VVKEGTLSLHFKGMESARSDWTELAKEFQSTLYMKVFTKEPVEEYILATVNRVKRGDVDDKLVYQKQLRKPLHEYTASIPPHVQAAKLLESPGHTIRYYITTDGPQPVEKVSAPLDYEHYIDAQLRPVADAILEWIDLDFDAILCGQQDLFDVP
jgi:DNA polymerase-2